MRKVRTVNLIIGDGRFAGTEVCDIKDRETPNPDKDIRLRSYEKRSHGPGHSQEGLRPEGSTSANQSSRVQEDRNS
jgi:hypothetical protein